MEGEAGVGGRVHDRVGVGFERQGNAGADAGGAEDGVAGEGGDDGVVDVAGEDCCDGLAGEDLGQRALLLEHPLVHHRVVQRKRRMVHSDEYGSVEGLPQYAVQPGE